MPLFDQRVFKWKGEWWAAEVHGGSGGGVGNRPRLTSEMVVFTNLTDENRASKTVFMPAGRLRRYTHEAIGSLLDQADDLSDRYEMSPVNSPDASEFPDERRFRDSVDLLWAYKDSTVPHVRAGGVEEKPVMELICLEDTAYTGSVHFADSETLVAYLDRHGHAGLQELANFVVQDFLTRDRSET